MAWWQTAIVVGLERLCAALDTASSDLGRVLHRQDVGGLGCRIGLSTLSFGLDRRWGGDAPLAVLTPTAAPTLRQTGTL